MATITTRSGKGSALTHQEVDANFTGLNTELGQKELASNKGVANGYASLDAAGKVPSAQLPSYVDDVVEAANLASLPGTGETGKIYVTLDTNKTYRWSGSAYVEISPSPGSTDSLAEGSTNLYFTQARARASVSASGSLSYNSSTGVMSFTDAVTSVAGRTGAVTLTSSDVGLGNVENKSSATIRGELTSSNVTTALGFTPYNATNPSGYITSSALSSYLPLSGGTMSGKLKISLGGGTTPSNYLEIANTSSTTGQRAGLQLNTGASWSTTVYTESGNWWHAFGSDVGDFRWGYDGTNLKVGSNTVLHAGNYNSYSPTLTGTGASGTWAINITGNAATATSATDSTKLPLSGGTLTGALRVQGLGTSNPTTADGTDNSILSLRATNALVRLQFGTRNTGNYAGWIQASYDNGGGANGLEPLELNPLGGTVNANGSAVLHAANYNSYALPLSGGTITGGLIATGGAGSANSYSGTIRVAPSTTEQWAGVSFPDTVGGTSNSNNYWFLGRGDSVTNRQFTTHIPSYADYGSTGIIPSWVVYRTGAVELLRVWADGAVTVGGNQVLHAANYNSYSPTLTGTGASGTWGISISGNAATATSATDSTKLPLSGGTLSGFLTINASDVHIRAQENGTGTAWRGRIGAFNSSADISSFLGNYNSRAGVFGHNNALTDWAPLWVNTLGVSGQGIVYLSSSTFVKSATSDTDNAIVHAGNYGSYALPLSGGTLTGGLNVGTAIGSRGTAISVSGSSNSSPIALKSSDYATVFGILPHSASWTYLSTGVYYNNGSWVHASADTNNALLGINGGEGVRWYASNNSTGSWNVANLILWNATGTWVGGLNAATGAQVNGSAILSAANYSSYALPLSGGTMTGAILYSNVAGNKIRFYNIATDPYGIDLLDSELRIYSGAQGSATGGITFGKYDGTTFTEHFRIRNNGGILANGSQILHAANYSSYALPLSGGTISGSLFINSGTSASDFNDLWLGGANGWSNSESHGINTFYGTVASPTIFTRVDSQFNGTAAVMRWKNFYYSGSQTSTVMTLTATGASTATLNVSGAITQSGSQVLTAGNYSSYALPLSGGTVTGTLGTSHSANATVYLGGISASWGGTSYPTLYSSSADRWVMHINPHISYVQNGTNGFTGSMTGATIRFASNTSASTYWDAGVGTNGVGTDKFSIGRAGSNFFNINNDGTVQVAGNTVLNASNYSSYALPLSGGAMTGNISGPAYNSPNFIRFASDNNWSYGCSYDGGSQYWMQVQFYGTGDDTRGFRVLDKNGDAVRFRVNGAGNVTASGNVTAYSDERLKKDWSLIESGFVDRLAVLRCGTYTRIDSGQRQAGVSAQNMREILPEVVSEDSDGTLALAYGNAALVSAVELAKELVALKHKVAELEARVH